eukprot:gene38166-50050_t
MALFYQRIMSVGLSTQSFPPIITGINPWFGGAEGGTKVTITGANFSPGGLWSEVVIYFGNDICMFDRYHSDDHRIVCTAPKCKTSKCMSSSRWNGNDQVNVIVYVSTVEGIVSASTTFWYYGDWTPSVNTMSHTAWASGTASVNVKAYTASITDFDITLSGVQSIAFAGSSDISNFNTSLVSTGSHNAYVGDNNELNGEIFSNMWSSEKIIYYRPPDDMTAGFYNLTVALQNDFSTGSFSTGYARMNPKHKGSDTYYYFYNFASTLSGTVYTLCLFPAITAISPSTGSLAGGTAMTITGFGFSNEPERLTVFVGGVLCDVTASTEYQISCTTRRGREDLLSLLTPTTHELNDRTMVLNSTRGFGSPGWWVKMWNYNDVVNKRVGNDVYVKESFPWRQGMYFSLYNLYGSNWPSILGYSSMSSQYYYYASDLATVLTAPYTGYYTFYLCTDDAGDLFISTTGVGKNEVKIASCTSYCQDGNFWTLKGQISKRININKGD